MVRQDNCCHPLLGQAAIVITPSQYDKRALTCTDLLALTNSLFNLSYMTSASTLRVAHHLASDGGLELIVSTLNRLESRDNLTKFAYSAGLTCLCNIAIRGNQHLRERLVEAGVIHVIIDLLYSVVTALERYKQRAQAEQTQFQEISNRPETGQEQMDVVTDGDDARSAERQPLRITDVPRTESTNDILANSLPNTASNSRRASRARIDQENEPQPITNNQVDRFGPVLTQIDENAVIDPTAPNLFDNPMMNTPTFAQATANLNNPQVPPAIATTNTLDTLLIGSDTEHFRDEEDEEMIDEDDDLHDVLYRVDDVLLAVKLIAYLSKYPNIRNDLHLNYAKNVFSLIEVFTTPSNLFEIKKWSVLCMRNAFKKDTAPGALRRCGNLKCSNWESFSRQYSKCSRCRRVSYCSKQCQKTAWVHHKNWCNKYEAPAEANALAPAQDANPTTIE